MTHDEPRRFVAGRRYVQTQIDGSDVRPADLGDCLFVDDPDGPGRIDPEFERELFRVVNVDAIAGTVLIGPPIDVNRLLRRQP